MTEVKIKLHNNSDNSYTIFIQQDCGEKIASYLKTAKLGNKHAIITDSKVYKLHAKILASQLSKHGIKTAIFHFLNGEKSKRIVTVEKLAEAMVNKGFDRKDAIIALGGGVVGDLAGFLASIYLRGIPYIQLPTTLLSMVDSSIGGKTGVDLNVGKNLLGTFTQPKAVFIDPKYLKTLPQKQIRNGLAEVIKYGVIKDKQLFKFIEQNLEKILQLEKNPIEHIIKRSVEIKSEIVEKDEKEGNLRMILNYGHTFGHALEKLSNYKLLHGYAISIGMVLANKMAVEKNLLDKNSAERIKKLLSNAGLPITTMQKLIMKNFANDKKRIDKYINFILPTAIGKVIIHKEACL